MKLKKWLAALLTLTMVATCLTACGEQSKPADKDSDDTVVTTTADQTDEETQVPDDETDTPSVDESTENVDKVTLKDIGFKNWQGYDTWVMIEGYNFDEGYVYTIGGGLSGMKFYEDYVAMIGVDENGNALEEINGESMTAMLVVNGNNSAMMTSGDYEQALVLNRIIDDDERWIIWKVDESNYLVPLDMIDFSRPTEDIIVPGYEYEYQGTKYYLK